MKLAEALQERADLNVKIEQLGLRLLDNAQTQEGETPAEDPNVLLRELDAAIDRLAYLMEAVNRTNCAVTDANGRSLTALIAKRDALKKKADAYRGLIRAASNVYQRVRGSEIRLLPAVDVPALQKQADAISKEIRTTDNALQTLNWTVDLIED